MKKTWLTILLFTNVFLSFLIVLSSELLNTDLGLVEKISAIVIVACSVTVYFIINSVNVSSSPLSVIDSTIELDLVDPKGNLAKYKKAQEVIANTKNVLSYIERGLTPDPDGGSIDKFRSFSNVGCSDLTQTEYHINMEGKYEVFFNDIPSPGEPFTRVISAEFVNSFKNEEEWFAIDISREVRKINIQIKFPQTRPFKTMNLFILDQYTKYKFEDPPFEIDNNYTLLSFTTTNPKVGTQFKFIWTW